MTVVDQQFVDNNKPPAGFNWRVRNDRFLVTLSDGFNSNAAAFVPDHVYGLWKWAKEKKVGLIPYDSLYVSTGMQDANVWGSFQVTGEEADRKKYFGIGRFKASCGHEHKVGEWFCKDEGSRYGGTVIICRACFHGGLRLTNVDGQDLCARCATPCTGVGCENMLFAAKRRNYTGDAITKCEKCCPTFKCLGCKKNHSVKSGRHNIESGGLTVQLCNDCRDNQICAECKTWTGGHKTTTVAGKRMCAACSDKVADRERAIHETFTADELPKHGKLTVPALPERPFRTISIETEVDGDREYISKTLYNCGLVRVPVVEAYGTTTPEDSSWAAFLKHDGSVTGGELITYLLQLDKTVHADAFLDVLKKVRSLHKVGKVEFNSNCGGHIHIDAHNFGSENVWRLLTVWNYLEDVIYRLAGAGHKYGHRTQDPKHDRANHGGGYANSPAKGPWGIKSNVTLAIEKQNRMCGLNFKPYLGALRYCRCGAVGKDAMRACTCVLPRCTIEWRVWNSQGNPRILHAWIAFMQAMHAYADVDEVPDKNFEDQFPTLEWSRKLLPDTSVAHRLKVKERLEWIFGNLTLTDDERDSLIYAFKQSDLKDLGVAYLDSLKNIPAPKNAERPKSRNVTVRKKAIVIKAPKPGDDPLARLSPGERERIEYAQRRRVAYR